MEMRDKKVGDITILTLNGNIDATTAQKATEYIQQQIASGNVKLIADFSAVGYTSSAGLRVLLGAIKETRTQSGDIYLAAAQPDVLKVLNMSGFTRIMKIFPDVDAALAAFA